jgi:hypothetical protein
MIRPGAQSSHAERLGAIAKGATIAQDPPKEFRPKTRIRAAGQKRPK